MRDKVVKAFKFKVHLPSNLVMLCNCAYGKHEHSLFELCPFSVILYLILDVFVARISSKCSKLLPQTFSFSFTVMEFENHLEQQFKRQVLRYCSPKNWLPGENKGRAKFSALHTKDVLNSLTSAIGTILTAWGKEKFRFASLF